MKEPHPLLVALIYAKEYRNAVTCTTRIIRIPVPLEAKSVLCAAAAAADELDELDELGAAELDELDGFAAT